MDARDRGSSPDNVGRERKGKEKTGSCKVEIADPEGLNRAIQGWEGQLRKACFYLSQEVKEIGFIHSNTELCWRVGTQLLGMG